MNKAAGLTAFSAMLLLACSENGQNANAQNVEFEDARERQGEAAKIQFVEGQGSFAQLNATDKDLAEKAVQSLSQALDIPESEIRVDTIRAVNWRDSSIGCPQPDRAYGQVITPGHRITLRVGKTFHFVHAANGRVFVCESAGKSAVGSVDAKRQLVWGEQMLWARQDLAAKLGVAEDDIVIRSALKREFPDASLGCPVPDVEYDATPRQGYVLTLSHAQRDFTYHTDLTTTIACPPLAVD